MENTEKPNHSVRFDGTINAGHLLTAIVMVVAMFGVYTANQIQLTRLDMRVASLENVTIEVRGELVAVRKSQWEISANQVRVTTILERIERQSTN